MLRPSSSLPLALTTLLLAGSAAAEPPPASAPESSPPAALPPAYFPPPPSYGPAYSPPSATQPLYPTSRMYSPLMVGMGVGLHIVGTVLSIIGSVAYSSNDHPFCTGIDFQNCESQHGGDVAVMVGGGIAFLAGIPLMVVGLQRVRVRPEDASLAPVITASPRGASVSLRF